MKTLIAAKYFEIDGKSFAHGSEIVPDLIDEQRLNQLIDHGFVREYDSRDRRSLHRLFARFSNSSRREEFDDDELAQYTLLL
jgi:hypothetical protein